MPTFTMATISSTDKPGPPINLAPNDTTKTSTRLTWSPPEDDGGSPVTGYFVERMATAYSNRWVKVNKEPISELTLSLDDLDEGNEYKFRVSAQNAAGVGEPCEPITLVAKDPFGEF